VLLAIEEGRDLIGEIAVLLSDDGFLGRIGGPGFFESLGERGAEETRDSEFLLTSAVFRTGGGRTLRAFGGSEICEVLDRTGRRGLLKESCPDMSPESRLSSGGAIIFLAPTYWKGGCAVPFLCTVSGLGGEWSLATISKASPPTDALWPLAFVERLGGGGAGILSLSTVTQSGSSLGANGFEGLRSLKV
jgi:hypothetical protein